MLRPFRSEQQYFKYKSDVRYFRVALHTILKKHDLYKERPYILAFQGGQNPAFWVDGDVVIKIVMPQFGGVNSYKIELEALSLLTKIKHQFNNIPYLIANGELYTNDDFNYATRPWLFPYTIQNFIKGRPIVQIYEFLTPELKEKAATFLGNFLKILHTVDINGTTFGKGEKHWDMFKEFLYRQKRNCKTMYQETKLLNPTLISQLDNYLPNNLETLYQKVDKAVFLHADLTNEHLLCEYSTENGETVFEPVSVIDFGDSRSGDPIYELLPIHIDIFKCDKTMTMALMKAYGIERFDRESFSYRAMCYTILHEQDALRSVYFNRPEWRDLQDMKELEKNLWDLPWE